MTVQELQALQQTNPEALAEYYKLKFVKTHPDAVLPKRNHEDPIFGDTGYDVTAVEDSTVPANGSVVVPVGLKLGQVPPGFWIRIESRSGLQFKNNIRAFNGIIDNNYRGDLGVKLINESSIDYTVKKGDRVAQLVLYPLVAVTSENVLFTDEVTATERGEKGFGASGR